MRAAHDPQIAAPAYRRVADGIVREIVSGELAPGARLPTVRELAQSSGLSPGTAKHVYDVLEREGYLVKIQGKGTFVREGDAPPEGGKARAMAAIDRLLDEMRELSFSWRETRIFIDLKLRQLEQDERGVRIAAVDCSPEALAMMKEQILALEHADVDTYLLSHVLGHKYSFAPRADIVVTTATHGQALAHKMAGGQEPVCLVMSLDAETAVELASIPPDARVGAVCKSERFAQIIMHGCKKYCKLKTEVQLARFGDFQRVREVAEQSDVLILAPNYRQFASAAEGHAVARSHARIVPYSYRVERGSLVYLENRIKEIHLKTGEGK